MKTEKIKQNMIVLFLIETFFLLYILRNINYYRRGANYYLFKVERLLQKNGEKHVSKRRKNKWQEIKRCAKSFIII